MILAVRYSIKGVKKAHKSYKQHQAEKEQKLLTERGQLPDLHDPSRELELDKTCLADISRVKSSSSLHSTSSASSASTTSAEKALENDPSFKEYMEKHRSLYLKHHRSNGSPPSYSSVMQQNKSHTPTTAATLSPTGSDRHCSCHECTRTMSSPSAQRPVAPILDIAELPPSATDLPHTKKISELSSSHTQPVEIMSREDDDIIFELPGNMPAILPLRKQEAPVELPSEVA